MSEDHTRTADRVFVAEDVDFDVGDTRVVQVKGREVAVVRTDDGYYGIGNTCPHQGGPVGEGQVGCSFRMNDGGRGVADLAVDRDTMVVACPWHGWPFELETGRHVTDPEYTVPTYDVVVDDGGVYLEV
jgi:nitrite reductase/ring-hydroxylating ferredoxin subunit